MTNTKVKDKINIINIIEQILADLGYRNFEVHEMYGSQPYISINLMFNNNDNSNPKVWTTITLCPIKEFVKNLLEETSWVFLNLGALPAIDFLNPTSIDTFKQIILMSPNLLALNQLINHLSANLSCMATGVDSLGQSCYNTYQGNIIW